MKRFYNPLLQVDTPSRSHAAARSNMVTVQNAKKMCCFMLDLFWVRKYVFCE